MIGECKYVILKKNAVPVLFQASVEHKDEANGRPVRSAGFVKLTKSGEICCYGRSESLGIESKPEVDSKLITAMLRG